MSEGVQAVSDVADSLAQRYLRLARNFENAAETYREVRLFGPANDAEARKAVCVWLAWRRR
jgi:hypothetical protein